MSREIPLTKGQAAIIDEEDYEMVSRSQWVINSAGYAHATREGKTISMHRLIMGAKKGEKVDHINRNRLDNRRANLRHSTSAQNQANRKTNANNTSGYKGVTWDKERGKWLAAIHVNGHCKNLGRFENPEDAAHAYDIAAINQWGEFARPNFGGI